MAFDPQPHMMQLKGKDYLPVFARLLWLRTDYPAAIVQTEMVEHEVGKHATFKAYVSIPDRGSATGWATETVQDFRDYLEKAETKAIGRALGALGFGTAAADFTYEKDEVTPKVVDSPIERQAPPLRTRIESPLVNEAQQNGARVVETKPIPATEPQIRAIYSIANSAWGLGELEIENRCKELYGRIPNQLTRTEAAELIDSLKRAAPKEGETRTAPSPTTPNDGTAPTGETKGSITESQRRAVFAISRKNDMDAEAISKSKFGKSVGSLSVKEASTLIEELQKGVPA